MIFPSRKAANVLRGSLGEHFLRDAAVSAALLEPAAGTRNLPGGFDSHPWPFVLRAAHLNGITINPGERFFVDVHYFQVVRPDFPALQRSFETVAAAGIGPGRGKARYFQTEQLDLQDYPQTITDKLLPPSLLHLDPFPGPIRTVRVHFASPTELKADSRLVTQPEFPVLIGRLIDRIALLSALYGQAPLAADIRSLRHRSTEVRIAGCTLARERTVRRSSRTGQVHPIGGFTGEVTYQGPLGEFLPWLSAARWVGVGRQTLWGKGDMRVITYSA